MVYYRWTYALCHTLRKPQYADDVFISKNWFRSQSSRRQQKVRTNQWLPLFSFEYEEDIVLQLKRGTEGHHTTQVWTHKVCSSGHTLKWNVRNTEIYHHRPIWQIRIKWRLNNFYIYTTQGPKIKCYCLGVYVCKKRHRLKFMGLRSKYNG